MATTYTPISTTTLGSNQTYITFSSIPSGYTDLVLVVSAWSDQSGTASNGLRSIFNSDTGSNYSNTYIYGDGSSAGSGRDANLTYAYLGGISQTSASSAYINTIHFMDYSNSVTYKTTISYVGRGDSGSVIYMNLWRNTSAINSIRLERDGSTNIFKTGTTATLYGIAAA